MEIPKNITTGRGLYRFLMARNLLRSNGLCADEVTFTLAHKVTRLLACYTVTADSIGILEAVLGAVRDGKAEITEINGEERYPVPQYRFY